MRRLFAAALLLAANAAVPVSASELVIASTYFPGDGVVPRHDYRTSSGLRYDASAMRVASPNLPLGTKLYLRHGHCIAEVTVSDRGPFTKHRALDLTPAVNKALCMDGLGRVSVEIWPPLPKSRPQ